MRAHEEIKRLEDNERLENYLRDLTPEGKERLLQNIIKVLKEEATQ